MKSVKQKTVVIAIPMLLRGGTEIQTLALVRVLRKERHRVIVCCYYEFENVIVAEFEKEGAQVHLLRLDRSQDHFSYLRMITLLRILTKFLQATSPDILHVQYVAPGLIPILAGKMAGVKHILATIHYPRHTFGKKEESFVRLSARLCSMFLCNSIGTEISWFGNGSLYNGHHTSRHCTVYNAIDAKNIEEETRSVRQRALKKRLGIKSRHVIGVVARLRSEKGHSFLFHAMKRVIASAPDTTLLLVGDGPDKLSLQSLAETLHIADKVLYLGSKTQEEAFRLFGVMDIVAVPSEFEGFGLSAAEAMAAALPVVASDISGLREVVEHGKTGILVPFGDSEKMASSLISLLSDSRKARALGKNGRLRVKRLFSITKFHKAIKGVYDQL